MPGFAFFFCFRSVQEKNSQNFPEPVDKRFPREYDAPVLRRLFRREIIVMMYSAAFFFSSIAMD